MYRIALIALSFLFIFSCAGPKFMNKYEIEYDDNFKEYVLYLHGDYKNCNNVKIEVSKDGKKLFQQELSGKVSDFAVNIPIKNLDLGENIATILCDEKKEDISISIWNFRNPILRYVFSHNYNDSLVTPEVEELMETDLFLNEFREFILKSEKNFVKASPLIEFLDYKNKSKILDEAAKKNYASKESMLVFYEYLKGLLFDDSCFNVIDTLFSRKDYYTDMEVFNILMSRPEKRIYDRYFNFFLKEPHLKTAILEHLIADRESQFFFEALIYFKDRIRKEGLKDPFVLKFAKNYFAYNSQELPFIIEMMKGQFYKDGILLLDINDLYEDSGKEVFKHYKDFNKVTKIYVLKRLLPIIGEDEAIFTTVIEERDKDFIAIQLEYISAFPNRYDDKTWSFIKKLVDENYIKLEVYNYLLNAPLEMKKYGFRKIYEQKGNLENLVNLKGVDDEYYENELVKIAKKTRKKDAVMLLAHFKEKYLDFLIEVYKDEKNVNDRADLLEMIAGLGTRGYDFALNEVLIKPYKLEYAKVLTTLTLTANEENLKKILEDIMGYPKEYFIEVTIGLENDKKRIDCDKILPQWFYNKKDEEEIIRVGWVWAYCCPQSYLDYIKLVEERYGKNEKIVNETLDGLIDIMSIFKIDYKEFTKNYAKSYFERFPNKYTKLKVAEILGEVGSKEDISYFHRLIEGEDDTDYIDMIIYFKEILKNRYNIVDETK